MRLILTILLIGLFNAEGQIVINASAPYRPSNRSLLNQFTGAAAAYSLRKLRNEYTGAAIRVRKDTTGQPEQDIFFTDRNDLDTAALKSFLNARSGFVTTWYDQSGNDRNATQTTQANQPRIALNGVIDRDGTKICVTHDGSNDRLISTFTISQPFHTFVASLAPTLNSSADAYRTILGGRNSASNDAGLEIDVNTPLTQKTLLYSGAILGDNTIRSGNSIISGLSNGSSSALHYNGVSIASGNAGSLNLGALHIGTNWDLTKFFNNKYYEIILYNSNQSSNRTGIESNINTYYGIY